MDNIEKFWTALLTLKPSCKAFVDGEVTTEEEFNNNIKWVTGKNEENNTAITVDTCPHSEITWAKLKEEMDKL